MSETLGIERWLYRVLSGDSVLRETVGDRIYNALAPQGARMPFLVYQYQAGRDVRVVGPARIMLSAVYLVKLVGSGESFAPLEAAAERVDQLLQGASGAVPGLIVLMCVREQPIAYTEVSDGVTYRHLGALWRIYAQKVD